MKVSRFARTLLCEKLVILDYGDQIGMVTSLPLGDCDAPWHRAATPAPPGQACQTPPKCSSTLKIILAEPLVEKLPQR